MGLRDEQGEWRRAVGVGLRDCSLSDVTGHAFKGECLYCNVIGLLFGGWCETCSSSKSSTGYILR
jgi:hypothetical protein